MYPVMAAVKQSHYTSSAILWKLFYISNLFSKKKENTLKPSFRNTIRVSNSLDQDQVRLFVGPDLGPNCLQRPSVENKKLPLAGKALKVK